MGGLPVSWFLEAPIGGSGNLRFVASTAPGGATDLKAARAAFMLFKI
jgi:hypothetical protein